MFDEYYIKTIKRQRFTLQIFSLLILAQAASICYQAYKKDVLQNEVKILKESCNK